MEATASGGRVRCAVRGRTGGGRACVSRSRSSASRSRQRAAGRKRAERKPKQKGTTEGKETTIAPHWPGGPHRATFSVGRAPSPRLTKGASGGGGGGARAGGQARGGVAERETTHWLETIASPPHTKKTKSRWAASCAARTAAARLGAGAGRWRRCRARVRRSRRRGRRGGG